MQHYVMNKVDVLNHIHIFIPKKGESQCLAHPKKEIQRSKKRKINSILKNILKKPNEKPEHPEKRTQKNKSPKKQLRLYLHLFSKKKGNLLVEKKCIHLCFDHSWP